LGRGAHHAAVLGHDTRGVGRWLAGAGQQVVGRRKHLQRAGDVQQLHGREGQQVDHSNGVWQKVRGLWHFRHTLSVYTEPVQSFPEATMIPTDTHLQIGSLLFEGVDQIDLTGPFEVLSRLPNTTYRIYGKTADTVRDLKGLRLTPDATLADAPRLDVLHVPGGYGQEAVMEDDVILDWVRAQALSARSVLSVCTGALILGAAGLLVGRRATTHWSAFDLLPYFGAIPVNQRVVVDGSWVLAAGVTAGIDGALTLAAELRGEDVARAIQLQMAYAPEPPFNSGTPETAPPAILAAARTAASGISAKRLATAQRVAARLGVEVTGG